MEQLETWITDNKIPIGLWAKEFIEWIKVYFGAIFDFISDKIGGGMDASVEWLQSAHVPPLIFIAVFAILAFLRQRDWLITLLVVIGFLFILNLNLWDEMIATLLLVVYSTLLSLAIGIPIGIICARRPWLYSLVAPVLDLIQTLPSFVYLVPALALFGLGMVPAVVATFLFAIAAPVRLTYLGISQVPVALVEAGESFGSTRWQLLAKVKLPAAMPTIMAGVTQTIMLSLSMVVIAALVGAPGLGVPVVRALAQANVALGFEGGLAIVVLAIILDRVMKQPKARRRQVKKQA
ncbi:ABC transporter permease [Dongia soli]|uniref:ABC transporter permease subunit n=1 Tax=Dongia soli TaxID=600628 RepID=A0ABU5E9S1_9PROT|nr:ABC transporter permease subunit [Dongia soli]MDY0882896.1 ABC transporter permease subunit [Dongia soli]